MCGNSMIWLFGDHHQPLFQILQNTQPCLLELSGNGNVIVTHNFEPKVTYRNIERPAAAGLSH